MKSEEEIKKKKEFIEMMLEEGGDDLIIGTVQRRKLVVKLVILNWVLGEKDSDRMKLRKKVYNKDVFYDAKNRILMFLEDHKDAWFTASDISISLNQALQSVQKNIRSLKKEGRVKCNEMKGLLGTPKNYKIIIKNDKR